MVVFSSPSLTELASKLIQQADSLSRRRYHGELLNAWSSALAPLDELNDAA
jgi:hypothetical protein